MPSTKGIIFQTKAHSTNVPTDLEIQRPQNFNELHLEGHMKIVKPGI